MNHEVQFGCFYYFSFYFLKLSVVSFSLVLVILCSPQTTSWFLLFPWLGKRTGKQQNAPQTWGCSSEVAGSQCCMSFWSFHRVQWKEASKNSFSVWKCQVDVSVRQLRPPNPVTLSETASHISFTLLAPIASHEGGSASHIEPVLQLVLRAGQLQL